MGKETKWERVNTEGVMGMDKPLNISPRPETLDGKTVLLRLNGKHNGDVFLNRIAELVTAKFKGVSIIKSWELAPETATSSWNENVSREFTEKLASTKPNICIGAVAD